MKTNKTATRQALAIRAEMNSLPADYPARELVLRNLEKALHEVMART